MRSSVSPQQFWVGLLCLAAAAQTTRPASAEAPIGTGWDLRCIRPGNAIAGQAQASTGVLWLGLQSGLMAWDGWELSPQGDLLAKIPSLGLKLAIERDDSLWISSGLGFLRPDFDGNGLQVAERGHPGLVRLQGDNQKVFTVAEGLPESHVWAIHVDRNGTVWAGTEKGVAKLEGGRFVSPVPATALPSPHVLALVSDARNDLWIGTTEGLARLRGQRVDVVAKDNAVIALAADDSRGLVWAASQKGVIPVRNLAPGHPLSVEDGLPTSAATALLVDRLHRLWVGTALGVALFDVDNNKPVEIFRNGKGLPDNRTHSLYEDREGGIWVGTRTGGACRLTPKSVWNLDTVNGVEPETVYSIMRASDGAMWVSSTSQVAVFRDGQLEQRWQPSPSQAAELRALTEAPDGSIWVTTTNAKLLRIRKPEGKRSQADLSLIPLPEKEFPLGQRTILFDADNQMWLGRAGGGLLYATTTHDLSASENWNKFEPEGVCQGETTAGVMARDKKTLWFGTEGGGATRWDGSRARCITTRDGLATNYATSFYEDPADGAIWIGTRNDAGLARYRDGKVARVRGDQGLYCDSIAGLVADGHGSLWTLCGIGIGRSKLSDLNAVADGTSNFAMTIAHSTDRSWETTVGTNPAGAIDEAGRFWWATLGGVTVVEPEKRPPVTIPRTPRIRLEIGGILLAPTNPVVSQNTDSYVVFHLSTPTFLPFYRSVFRHRLDGVDKDWVYHFVDWAEYPKLATGTYRLHAGVSDGFGGWSDRVATLDLHIRPPFYKTLWFSVAVFAGLALVALAAMKLRERTLRLRHATTIAERTRIARDLHDVIGQAFAGIGLLLDAIRTTHATSIEPVKEIADRAREVLDHCDGNIRTTIWELRQPGGEEAPLAELAAKIVEETRRSIGEAGPTIRLDSSSEKLVVPELVRHELPHVLREALSNAIKHARAQTVLVNLRHDRQEASLTVEDDGRGISINDQAVGAGGRFGILGMQERARRMGGKLWFEARPGGGTVLRLRVPLNTRTLEFDES